MCLVDLHSVDSLEHEHALGDVRPDHLGHDELLVLLDEPPDHLRVVGFLDEVELVPQVRFQLFGERLELEQLRRLRVALEQLRRRAEHLEVELDLLDDPGPAHLDDDATTRLQQGCMDLGDRRGGERLGSISANGSSPRSSAITGSISA